MKTMRLAVLFVMALILFVVVSCASTHKKDIESIMISAFIETCKTAEVKFHGDRDIYIISPTGKMSANGCPMALITGWSEGRVIKEKEVEVCECRLR